MTVLELLIAAFCLTLMLVGLAGIVSPKFPGIHLVWFGVFLFAVATGFRLVSARFLAITAVLVLLSYILDYWNVRWGLKQFHASWHGVVGAVIGGLIASFFGIFPALTIGPVLGAIVGQMLAGHDSIFAIETNEFKLVGFIGSTLIKIVLGIVIIGSWLRQIL